MGFSLYLKKRLGNFLLDVSWDMDNEMLVLFGPSGAGKSLTLQMIAGLIEPDEGFVYSGKKILFDRAKAIHIPPQQRSLGYVFQDRVAFPHMTVRENIAYGLTNGRKADKERKVNEMINLFHLEMIARKHPGEISGGQKQRVTLARALIGRPDALLLDEPFSALDSVLRTEMRELLRYIRQQFNTPIILVTHDIQEAYSMADKVVVYSSGRIAQIGTPNEIFQSSSNLDADLQNLPPLTAPPPELVFP
jgi:molybdate transport system ATP-binding protein